MIRSMVDAAVVVCSVPKTRWPVSAVSMAMETVSRVAHLAHEDDVGILPERGPERVLERPGVQPHLALGHQALLALVHELDRVFDRDDVIGAGAIDEVHQRREGGALARPGRAGDHHEALREVAEILYLPAEAHLVGGAHLRGNHPEDRHRAMAVAARVAAKAGEAVDLIGPVYVPAFPKLHGFPGA